MTGSIHFHLSQRVLLQEQAIAEFQLERLFLSEIVKSECRMQKLRKTGLI